MIRAIELLPTPLQLVSQTRHRSQQTAHTLWASDQRVLALFHSQVETSDELLSAAFGPGCAARWRDDRHSLQQQVVWTDGNSAGNIEHVVERLRASVNPLR